MVGASSNIASGSVFPTNWPMRCISFAARREWPPTSKKLSCAFTGLPNTSCQICAMPASKSSLAANAIAPCFTGSGRFRLSTFPLGVIGIESSVTINAGTI
jgi:hypothetical protein